MQWIPALDGIRGMAILLVLLVHFTDPTPGASLVNRIYQAGSAAGWIGVDLFFVLSGFLITRQLLEAKGSSGYFRNFYGRRTLRIFPLYYVCLLAGIVVVPALWPPSSEYARTSHAELWRDQAWYWSYLSNWKMGLDGHWPGLGFSVYWSLAVEEQFYLVWPLAVLLCSPRTLRLVCISLIIGALILRIGLVLGHVNPLFIYVSTLTRIDTLAVGALIASIGEASQGWASARHASHWIGPGAAILLAGVWLVLGEFDEYHPLMQTLGFTLLALMFGAMLTLAVTSKAGGLASAWWSSPVLRFFGKHSYAMYLLHLTVAGRLVSPERAQRLVPSSEIGAQAVMFVLSTMVTVVVALIAWHSIEKHFNRLKRYFPRAPLVRGSTPV